MSRPLDLALSISKGIALRLIPAAAVLLATAAVAQLGVNYSATATVVCRLIAAKPGTAQKIGQLFSCPSDAPKEVLVTPTTPAPTTTAQTTPAAQPAASGMTVGMNLSPVSYYAPNEPFIDRFKTSSGWRPNVTNAPVPVDRYGNPLAIPAGASSIVTEFGVDPTGDRKSDVYLITYKGTGTFSFAQGRIVSSTPGAITLNVDAPNSTYVYTQLSNMDPKDPVRDIHIVRQDQLELFKAGKVFNPAFIEKTKGWRVLRFMDWQNTNNSGAVSWADRSTEANATWGSHKPDGTPIEIMVKLANETHADMWFNMPTRADDTYARNALALIRDTLDPALKVHVEYSNEVWNFATQAPQYLTSQATALWGVDANHDGKVDINDRAETVEAPHMVYYGYRAAQIAKIAREVFAATPGRVLPVLGSQTVWADLTNYSIQGMGRAKLGAASSLFSEYAVTTYFGAPLNTQSDRATQLGWARSGEAGIAAAFRELEYGGSLSSDLSLAAQRRFYASQGAKATEMGLTLVAYEGGSHLVGGVPDTPMAEQDELTVFYGKLSNDPRMGVLYTKMVADFAAAGGKTVVAFNDVGGNSKFGYWGALDTIYASGSPRYDALKALAR